MTPCGRSSSLFLHKKKDVALSWQGCATSVGATLDQYNTVRGTAATSHIRDAQPRETPTRADDTGLPAPVEAGLQRKTDEPFTDYSRVPEELRRLARWVPWALTYDARKPGEKPGKVPLRLDNAGYCTLGSSMDPSSWTTFDKALAAVTKGAKVREATRQNLQEKGKTLEATARGIGFIFAGEGIVGIDLDKCIDEKGTLAPWAQEIVDRFPTWTEVSVTGTGLHLFVQGKLPEGHKTKDATKRIEVYSTGRFFAVTGIEWPNCPSAVVAVGDDLVAWHAATCIGKDRESAHSSPSSARLATTKLAAGDAAEAFAALDDDTRRRVGEAACENVKRVIELFKTPEKLKTPRRTHLFVCGCRIGGVSGFAGDAEKFVEEMVQLTLQTALAMGVPDAWDHERQVRNGVDKGKLEHEPVEKLVMKTAKKGDKQRAATKNEVLALVDIDGLVYDEYLEASYLQDGVVPPWNAARHGPRKLDDQDAVDVTLWIEAAKNLRCDENLAGRMLWRAAKDHPVDRLREYLLAPRWDGIQRLDTWLSVYLGADDNGYNALVGRKWLIQAVARALKPGCKADNVLVLEGKQGAQKSTALSVLGGGGQFFNDQLPDNLGDKDASLAMNGTWIVEMADLHSLSKTRVTMLKAFITRQVDRFRPPYGKNLIDTPRRSVLAGTTNEKGYLVDETGNRRFWPVACGEEPEGHPFIAQRMQALRDDVTMLWAEAVAAYNAGEAWWLTTEAQVNLAKGMQEERIVEHPLALQLERALAGREWKKKLSPVVQLTMDDALSWAYEMNDPNHRKDSKAVAALLQKNGFRRVRGTTKTGERPWVYVKDGYSFCDRHAAVFGYGNLTLLEHNAHNAALEETFFAETKRGVDALAELAGNPVP